MVRERGKSASSSAHYDDDHHGGSNSSSNKSLISNRSSKVFAKRTMNLKKKMYELTTLCGLDGCLIVKGPNGELETWPENRDEVEHVVQRYMDMNEEDRHKNNKDLSSFLIEKKKKLELKIDEIRHENYSKTKSLYSTTWNNYKLDELSEDSLREMQCSLESKLENVNSRVKMKMKKAQMMMMKRGDDDHTATTSTINPNYSVKAEIFAAMGGGGCLNYDQDSPLVPLLMFNYSEPQHGGLDSTYINPPLMPQTRGFYDFNPSHLQPQQNHNLPPIRAAGIMSSMHSPGLGTMENQHLPPYNTNLMGGDGNYSTNMVSLPPPLPPTEILSHDQPPVPLQIEDHGHFLDSIFSHHQQQQQDFGFMPINEGDTY